MVMNRVRRIETWARLGYAARGLVYLLLGWIALSSGRTLSTGEAVKAFDDLPGGDLLLVVLALGLFGYGLYKIYSALLDLDDEGHEPKGLVVRAVKTLGGLAYWLLSFIAVRQIAGQDQAAESGSSAGSGGADQEAANQVAQATGGDLLLTLAGLALLALAAAQFWIAYKAKFMQEMPGAPPIVKPAGQVGYAARALVGTIVGWFVLKAGMDGERLRNFGDALALVRDDYPWLFKAVAIGLVLFGLTSLVMARYRRIEDEDVVARLSQAVRNPASSRF
jgi:hypothetical protein